MQSPKLLKFAVSSLGLAVALAGCGAASPVQGGSGGNGSGSGGSASGGTTGSGGTSSGGVTGSGGTSSGGNTGSGGTSSGGTTGSGGTSSGGVTGTTGSGGTSSGGTTASGGSAAGGATAGGGGRNGAGGGRNGAGGGATGSGSGGAAGGSSGSGSFVLTSPDQMDNAKFDTKFTCAESPALSGKMVGGLGNGINPELDWTGVPAGTMSFAITFLDTTLIDANMASLGNHWAIINIPASVMKFPQGTLATLPTEYMMAKQTGAFLTPCAQSLMGGMDDKYEFTIYALSTPTLTVSGTFNVASAVAALKAATPLGTAKLHGHAGVKGM